jgi:hypothetical protein
LKRATACANQLFLSVLILDTVTVSSASASGVPQPTVFRWSAPNGPANVDTYAQWLNRPEMWAEDFLAHSSWDSIRYPGWLTGPWATWLNAQAGRRLLIGIPMIPGSGGTPLAGTSLAQGATGAYNSYFIACAQDLVNRGIADQVIIRLGWEFNGGWYPWRAAQDPTSWKRYWQKIVTAMRSVSGASGLKFCFNPIKGYEQLASDTVYPGDAYVDYIGLDCYDECYNANTYPYPPGAKAAQIQTRRTTAWNIYLGGTTYGYGLLYWYTFAVNHGKGFGIAEWGVCNKLVGGVQHGGLDNDYYIQQMFSFLNTRSIAFQCYFDVEASDGKHQLSPVTTFPLASAKFLQLFQNQSAATAAASAVPSGALLVGSNTWSWGAGGQPGGWAILKNGSPAGGGSGVALFNNNGTIRIVNSVGGWYQWNGSSWISSTPSTL